MMEAKGKYEFVATAEDELSFKKGHILKVMDTTQDKNWFKAEMDGKEGFIPHNYIEWKKATWYVENVNRGDAEKMLTKKDEKGCYLHEEGAFLVRNSESTAGEYSLSVKTSDADDTVQHFKILRENGKYHLWTEKFNSINELVDFHRHHSVSRTQKIFLKEMGQKTKLIALYDFTAEDPEEISFKKGDVILKTGENDINWWRGRIHGKEGLFPSAYVQEDTDCFQQQTHRFTQPQGD